MCENSLFIASLAGALSGEYFQWENGDQRERERRGPSSSSPLAWQPIEFPKTHSVALLQQNIFPGEQLWCCWAAWEQHPRSQILPLHPQILDFKIAGFITRKFYRISDFKTRKSLQNSEVEFREMPNISEVNPRCHPHTDCAVLRKGLGILMCLSFNYYEYML
ncbi:hypothetical protein RHMOL_Rhmol02G0187700 [Rhododendron molle]|uniref:Uncharacterized protein n=1 Tax=Rhododendron molle TaxID=49168 RepID=A0ACC0PUG7_RHOML|nr:hypothetical protein RHMOL_Rhmol02G0187700 [Rhododendron molle]